MSAKRKPSAFSFQVKVTPKKAKVTPEASSDTVLILAPFQPHPKLTLENVGVGTTGRLQLPISNPTSKDMNIELVNAPSEEEGFVFSDRHMTVPGGSSVMLSVEWTPKHSCSTRHVIGVRPKGRARNLSEIILTVSTPKQQDLKSRLVKERKLAKTEFKMSSRTSKPLTEKNHYQEQIIIKEEINLRRSTFAVDKRQKRSLAATDTDAASNRFQSQANESPQSLFEKLESQNLSPLLLPQLSQTSTITTLPSELRTPLKNLQSETVVDMRTPEFFNEQFDFSTFTKSSSLSSAQQTSERISTDSLECDVESPRNIAPDVIGRRLTRSSVRLSLEGSIEALPTTSQLEMNRNIQSELIKRRIISTDSLECDLESSRNILPDVIGRRLTRSSMRLSLEGSFEALPTTSQLEMNRNIQSELIKKRITRSGAGGLSLEDSIESLPTSSQRELSRNIENYLIESSRFCDQFNLEGPIEPLPTISKPVASRNIQPGIMERRLTRSCDRLDLEGSIETILTSSSQREASGNLQNELIGKRLTKSGGLLKLEGSIEDLPTSTGGESRRRSKSYDGAVLWNVSPPKKMKLKVPSDSPVVLPPPSRMARRSTVVQRLSQVARTDKKSFVRARCDSLTTAKEKPVSSSSVLTNGSASLERPLPKPRSVQATKAKPESCRVSRLVPRRLRLGSSVSSLSSASSMTSLVDLPAGHQASATASAFLCQPSATNELPSSFLGRTIDLTKNPFHEDAIIYLDNSWIDETEKELLKWVNKILSPPLELEATCLMPSKQELQSVRAPIMGHATHKQPPIYRLFSVRRAATALLLSPDVARVLHKVHAAIDKESIAVRADKDLHRDVGLQGFVLRLLMCYHPLWLRVALEAVYGRPLHLQSNSDVVGLVNFIRRNLLSDNYLKTTYSHPSVPNLMLPPFEEKMKKFILNKFVMIVYFLDQAKKHKLIRHDPCLFCKDSPFKESRAILLEFNKELMKGGDMTKYLGTMGLKFEYKQTYLEEFDFKVKDRSDLRDGVRLVKLVDIMLNERICSKLRTPAISRTQKVHNVSVALTTYQQHGNEIENHVTAKDVVDGHREQTLSLLWQLRGTRQVEAVRVLVAFWLQNRPMIKQRMLFLRQRLAAQRLQKWYRAVANADRVRFRRLKAKACIIQRHWRAHIAMKREREYFLKLKKAALLVSEKRAAILKMRIARNGFFHLKRAAMVVQSRWRRAKMNTEMVTISRLALQNRMQEERNCFLKLRSTAIYIQRKWRLKTCMRQDRQLFLTMKRTAVLIGDRRKSVLAMRHDMSKFQNIRNTAIFIQRLWRAKLSMRQAKTCFLKQKSTTIFIQRKWRLKNLMRQDRRYFLAMKRSAMLIGDRRKSVLMMRHDMSTYQKIKNAAIFIQRLWRAKLSMRQAKTYFVKLRSTTIFIQRKWRMTNLMRQDRRYFLAMKRSAKLVGDRRKSVLMVRQDMSKYHKIRNAAIFIQRLWRTKLSMRQAKTYFVKLRLTTIFIQRMWRLKNLMRQDRQYFIAMKRSAMLIGDRRKSVLMMRQEMSKYQKIRNAAIFIQRLWRAKLSMRQAKTYFVKLRSTTIFIQRMWRLKNLMRQDRQYFIAMKRSAMLIGDRRKSVLMMRQEMLKYQKIRNAAIFIQRLWRTKLSMRNAKTYFGKLRSTTLFIQRKWRLKNLMRQERRYFLAMKRSVMLIEDRRKSVLLMRHDMSKYQKIRSAAITIQLQWRGKLLRRREQARLEELKRAVVVITDRRMALNAARKQRNEFERIRSATLTLQRKLRATLLMRKQKYEFMKIKTSTLFLQRKWRSYLQMKKDRAAYVSLKYAATIVADRRIALLKMRQDRMQYLRTRAAIITIQKRLRIFLASCWRNQRNLNQHAIIIQRVWRGYRCRKALEQENRLSFRTRALPMSGNGKTLRQIKYGLLHTLCQSSSLHVLIRSLKELDMLTTMSRVLADELVHEGIVEVLCNLLKKVLSRGVSDQQAALLVVTVLANIYKHKPLAGIVWMMCVKTKLPAQIFNWAANSCRTNTELFCACITLLWLWAHKPANCPYIVSGADFYMKRIGVRMLQLQEAEKQRPRAGSGHPRRLTPSTTPDWGYRLRINYRPRQFEDPVHAWSQLKILLGPQLGQQSK